MLQRYDYILPEIALIAVALYCAVTGSGILRAQAASVAAASARSGGDDQSRSGATSAFTAPLSFPSASSASAAPAAATGKAMLIVVNPSGDAPQYALNGSAMAGIPELRTALLKSFAPGASREVVIRVPGTEVNVARMRPLIEMLAEMRISFRPEEAK